MTRAVPPALAAHLASGATTLAWCWKVTRPDGTALGFTDHDRDLVFDGVTFRASTGFTASEIKAQLGAAVDDLEATGALQSDGLAEDDLAAGLYDGAAVEVWRVNWSDVAQRLLVMAGTVGEVERTEIAFRAEIRSLSHALAEPQGRIYGATCDATLGDARCGVDLDDAAFRAAGTVVAADGARIDATGLDGFSTGWFDRGRLVFTSGAAAGLSFGVASFVGGTTATLRLVDAPTRPIVPGDGFEVFAGCDKRFETCRDKFANVLNFRGFPHMPGEDFVTEYPRAGDELDGADRYETF